jgi:hypothetical protein
MKRAGCLVVFALFAFSVSAEQTVGWQELPNTWLKSVVPPDNFGGNNYDFSYHARAVIAAWSGGIADTQRNRMIIWGGGHNDYYGNELYSLNLSPNPSTLTRVSDPSPNGIAITVQNNSTGKKGNLGGNTYRNNIIVGSGSGTGSSPPGHYPPVVFTDGDKDYFATSVFENNIIWSLVGASDNYAFGFGHSSSYGYQSYTMAEAASLTTIRGSLHADPKFKNADPANFATPLGYDFMPQGDSPAIGAGLAAGSPVFDLVGNNRPSPPSIGALEIASAAPPPVIVSGPIATPNPAFVDEVVTMTAAATDPANLPLIYTWDMADGVTGEGASATHAFTAPGTYAVKLTVSNGTSQTSTTMQMVVKLKVDGDGDGGGGGGGGGTAEPIQVVSAIVKLNFVSPGKDSVYVSGLLVLPAGSAPSGQSVRVVIAGVLSDFILDRKGKSISANSSFKLTARQTAAKFTFKATRLNLTTALEPLGFVNATVRGASVSLPMTIVIGEHLFEDTAAMTYTARAVKKGWAR